MQYLLSRLFRADALGSYCWQLPRRYRGTGFDLTDGETLEAGDVEAAVDVVWRTGLPFGLKTAMYISDVFVLLYPRSVDPFDATTAEWVVVLTARMLE